MASISLPEFLQQMVSNPAFAITVLLTLGVILVNGWTDAPNAIATCVSTRSISARGAILMAAVFNFLGVLVMTLVNATVAETIYKMVDFGGDTHQALIALCAALFAIVTWATAAWKFGIPTSESHALIAGISGAAIALHNGLSGINGAEWIKVISVSYTHLDVYKRQREARKRRTSSLPVIRLIRFIWPCGANVSGILIPPQRYPHLTRLKFTMANFICQVFYGRNPNIFMEVSC